MQQSSYKAGLKTSENEEMTTRYQTLVNFAVDSIISINQNSIVILWNPAAEKMFGYTQQEVLGKDIAHLIIPPAYRERHYQGMARMLATGEAPLLNKTVEIEAQRKNGEIFPIELSLFVFGINSEREYTAIVRDISHRKKLEAELKQKNEALETTIQARTVQLYRSLEREHLTREIVNSIRDESELETILGLIAKRIGELADADRCVVWEFDDQTNQFRIVQEYRRDETIVSILDTFQKDVPILPFKLDHRQTIVISDLSQQEGLTDNDLQMIRERGIKSLIHVPILYHNKFFGLIRVHCIDETCEWDDETITMVRDVASQTAVAIHKAKLMRDLQRSEQEFQTLANSISNLAWMANQDGWVFWYNQRWYEYTGTTREEMEGWGWQSVQDPEILPTVLARWKSSIATGEPFDMVFPIKGADGIFRPFLTRVMPVKDTTGTVVRWFGTNTDITEQKEAEAALRESEERFRTLVNGVKEYAIYLEDLNGNITSWNEGAERIFGYPAEEIVGKPFSLFFPPELLKTDLFQQELETASSEGKFEVEGWRVRKDGSRFWANVVITALHNEYKQIIGFSNITRDVTQHKRAFERERLLRRIVEFINQSFDLNEILDATAKALGDYFQADRTYVIRYEKKENYFNVHVYGQYIRSEDIPVIDMSDFPIEMFKTLTKNLPVEEAMRPQRFTTPEVYLEDIQRRMTQFTHISDEEKAYYTDYFKRILIDKYCTNAMLRVGIYYRGIPYGVITLQQCRNREWTDDEVELLQDIATHIGVAFYQADLFALEQKAKEEAERANKRKSQFISNISHELRTPLNAVIGYSEMMLAGMATSLQKQEQYARNISLSGRHLLDIVNDILDVSKIEAGKVNISIQYVQLEPLLRELKELLKESAAKKQVEITFEIQPGLEGLNTDPQRLRQIFLNLLNNAVKFNKIGGQVRARAYKTEDEQWIMCEVEDTGIGIPQDKIAELFTEFYQVDNSVSRKYEGTGLGLALTKMLVELQGGQIWVESEEGVGSTFTFRLPVITDAQLFPKETP